MERGPVYRKKVKRVNIESEEVGSLRLGVH